VVQEDLKILKDLDLLEAEVLVVHSLLLMPVVMELPILVEVGVEVRMLEVLTDLVVPVVPVSSLSVIRSVNSQSKQLVEQFLTLVERLFIPLHHQRPLPSLILL
jgi:hypothetical protein